MFQRDRCDRANDMLLGRCDRAACSADTKHYWKLTKHIFRYGHTNDADSFNGGHTVNEGTRLARYDLSPIVLLTRGLQHSAVRASSRLFGSLRGSS